MSFNDLAKCGVHTMPVHETPVRCPCIKTAGMPGLLKVFHYAAIAPQVLSMTEFTGISTDGTEQETERTYSQVHILKFSTH